VKSLVHERTYTSGRMNKAKQGRRCSGPLEETLNGKPHFTDRKGKGSSICVVCEAKKLWKENILLQDIQYKGIVTQVSALNCTKQSKASEEFLNRCICKCIQHSVSVVASDVLNVASLYCTVF
jgi:hypothetical protein